MRCWPLTGLHTTSTFTVIVEGYTMQQGAPQGSGGPRARSRGRVAAVQARERTDENFRRVLDATALLVGQRFLDELARHLALTLGVRFCLIGEMLRDDVARAVAWWADGSRGPPFEYALSGTPCEAVLEGESSFYPAHVRDSFPDDHWLTEKGIESYLAVPCFAPHGGVIGHLAVLDTKPMEAGFATESLLRTLATRVAGELERRQVERALRESEARFRLLAEHAPDIIYHFDVARGVFDYISPSVKRTTGYDPHHFLDDPTLAVRIVHPDDRAAIQRILSADDEKDGLCRWIRQDGTTRWAEYRNVPVRDDTGTIVALEGIIRDVTDRVQLEEELHKTQQYHTALIDALPDMILRGSPEGVILDFEPAEEADPLLLSRDLVGKSVFDVLPDSIAESVMRAIRETLRTGAIQQIELTVEARGEQRYYEARFVPCANGTVVVIVRNLAGQRPMNLPVTMRREPTKTEPRAQIRLVRENKYRLTSRELSVLQYIAEGAADKEIAEALGISAYTVNKHVSNILAKMRVTSRTGAGVRALRDGLLG